VHPDGVGKAGGRPFLRTAGGLGNPRDSRLGSLRYKKSANNFGMHRLLRIGQARSLFHLGVRLSPAESKHVRVVGDRRVPG
jgi:hypothetical protein